MPNPRPNLAKISRFSPDFTETLLRKSEQGSFNWGFAFATISRFRIDRIFGGGVDFFAFNKAYVERLRNGDPTTEHHFFAYFEKLMQIKLRARAIGPDKVEDIKQDTFVRVISAVRKEGGVREPERFGAFVNSICNNVLLEYYRSRKNQQLDERQEEIPSKMPDLEAMMVSKQCSERVRKILSGLPTRDRELLWALFWEEKDRDTVCRDIGADRNYLRVLLHRAKDKFKAVYESQDWRVRRECPNEEIGYTMFEMAKLDRRIPTP